MNKHLFRKCLLSTDHTALADTQINKVHGHLTRKDTPRGPTVPGLSGTVKDCCRVFPPGDTEWHPEEPQFMSTLPQPAAKLQSSWVQERETETGP